MKAKNTGKTERQGVHLAAGSFEEADFAFRVQDIDFGIDAVVERIDAEQATGRLLGVQIKSGSSYFDETLGNSIVFRTDADHVEYWVEHSLPVIICLCDLEEKTVYWALADEEAFVATGKGYKLFVPRAQVVSAVQREKLSELVTPVVPANKYTVIGPDDVSHGLAKRYSFKILLNGPASRAEVAAILRQVTTNGARRSYNRSAHAARRWGDADADVVWAYIYPSAQDLAVGNAVARSQWMAEVLDDAARPQRWVGEEACDGLVIVWNSSYSFLADFINDATVTKETYLAAVDEVLPGVFEAERRLTEWVSEVSAGRLSEESFVTRARGDFDLISAAESRVDNLGAAPYECTDADLKLASLMANLGSVVLYFTAATFLERTTRNRIWLASRSLEDATSDVEHLKYELSKVR